MPALNQLTDDERDIIRRCVHAAVEGPFFEEPDFHSLMGVSRAEARRVVLAWSSASDTDETVALTINNALVNLLGYPHGETAAWDSLIGVPPAEVQRVLAKWRESSIGRVDIA